MRSFDGTPIACSFFPAAGLRPPHRAPTVLVGPGWGSGRDTDENDTTDASIGSVGVGTLRHAGYNVLTWDPRGFGQSGGTVELDSQHYEARDVSAVIDYVARRPEALLDGPGDPRVGMAGASYGGGIQLVAAATDDRIDAIVPDIAWHSLLQSLYPNGTLKTGWGQILLAAVSGRMSRLDPHLRAAFPAEASGTASRAELAWFASRGPGALVGRIRAPTLLIQGTADNLFPLDQAVDNYEVLRRDGVPTKMVWFCGGHGACITNPGDTGRIQRDTLAWLARYLKRDPKASTGAGFEWVDQDGRSHSAHQYPPTPAGTLQGDGSGTLPLVGYGGSGPVVDPSLTGVAAIGATVAGARASVAVNVAIRPQRALVAGAPQLAMTYSSSGASGETRVFAQVVDDSSGKVLGNQVTPVPLRLDGRRHTVRVTLETIAASAEAGLTLQITPSSTLFRTIHAGGALELTSLHVALPAVRALIG